MRATVGMVLAMGATEATATVGMGVATAPQALPVDMVATQGQVPMLLPTLGRSTLQRGPLSQRLTPGQLATRPSATEATLGWVGMGLGLEATLPLDTLYLLTLHWATPQATQGAMGFTTATEATVDCTEAPITAK